MSKDAPERIWAEAFWSGVNPLGEYECWPWLKTKMGRGYGSLRVKGANPTGAHRVSWAIHNGRWPKRREVVMHSCDNPICVNPNHLSVGSQSDNIQDCVRKGRHKPYRKPKAAKCKNGHEYTEETTEFVMSRGLKVRRCKKCKSVSNKRWRQKNAGRKEK